MKNLAYFSAVLLLFSCGSKEEKVQGPAKAPQITVDVVELKEAAVARNISIPGGVVPNEEVQLFSEVSGRIQRISFKEGQLVSKGTVLVQVDTDILKAQRKQLQVDLDLAKKDETRKKALFTGKGISAEEYEKSASNLESIQAQIELINVQISKATIRAPFSGRIGLRRISEGAFVNSSTLITSIVQENPIKIEFAVSERFANSVKPGQTIYFKTDGSTETYDAKVYASEPMIEAGTRMMTVRAQTPNKGKLVPGTLVSIDYDLGNEQDAFMVPAESIIPILKGQKILVVRQGIVVEVPVQIGVRTEDQVQIIGDVKVGDQVLITGLMAVKAGMPVTTKIVSK